MRPQNFQAFRRSTIIQYPRFFTILILLTSSILLVKPLVAKQLESEQVSNQDLERLDLQFKQLSAEIYQYYSLKQAKQLINHDFIQLSNKILQLSAANNHFEAIVHIKANLKTIKANLDNPKALELIKLLLKHNERSTADSLYREILIYNDQFLTSNAALLFAKHHAKKQQWEKTLHYLKGDFENLALDDIHYTYILNGIALQYFKKHRDAVKLYEKVPENSKYYTYAQLNIAIAYIRQDWWTDAHITINKLLQNDDIVKEDELSNRLYLILGYSLLNKEFYRESREAFRNINLNSQYIFKALLGISLTAASQNDYIGALNALTILKEKNTYDLEVEESYLLFPFIYDKLKQQMTTTASYSESMAYYQKRIIQINSIIAQKRDNNFHGISDITIKKNATIIIQQTPLTFTELYPESFLNNLLELEHFGNVIKEPALQQKINTLQTKHNNALNKMTVNLLSKRVKILDSYLNQSRYGLAKLYDKSNTSNE